MGEYYVTYEGPFFDGRDIATVEQMCHAIASDVTDMGNLLVHEELTHVLRHPTGRFQAGVHGEAHGDEGKITDGGIIYGHWLEGTGSRNSPVTRFKGYFTFRRTTQKLDAIAGEVANRIAGPFIGRM